MNACSTGTSIATPPDFYSDMDSTWRLTRYFQLAYEFGNLEEFMNCLHSDSEFFFESKSVKNSAIYSSWGRVKEKLYRSGMFAGEKAEVIELLSAGTGESPWYGDSTGSTIMLFRSFDLKVFSHETGEQNGHRAMRGASGEA
ncbi:hypothetical protein CSA37_11275 [Candidatus Fermentibacteria bacterium]|nr:MAG: hypothetical protein CSA37_11275 [Candidatus Fermentibacteria bacterium]